MRQKYRQKITAGVNTVGMMLRASATVANRNATR